MGANISNQSLEQYVQNNINFQNFLSQNLNVSSNIVETQTNKQTLQTAHCEKGNGPIIHCDVDVSIGNQNITTNNKIISKVKSISDFSAITKFNTQLVSKLKELAEDAQKGGFGINIGNQNERNRVVNKINDVIHREMNTEKINKIIDTTFNIQDGKIDICGWTITGKDNCKLFNQGISANTVVQAVLNSASKGATNDSELASIYNELQAIEKSKQTGFLGGLSGIIMMMVIGAIVVAVLGSLFYYMSKSKDNKPNAAAVALRKQKWADYMKKYAGAVATGGAAAPAASAAPK